MTEFINNLIYCNSGNNPVGMPLNHVHSTLAPCADMGFPPIGTEFVDEAGKVYYLVSIRVEQADVPLNRPVRNYIVVSYY